MRWRGAAPEHLALELFGQSLSAINFEAQNSYCLILNAGCMQFLGFVSRLITQEFIRSEESGISQRSL